MEVPIVHGAISTTWKINYNTHSYKKNILPLGLATISLDKSISFFLESDTDLSF